MKMNDSRRSETGMVIMDFVNDSIADGDLLHYSEVASEPLESTSKAPAAEVAASS